ncbi:uncharacterized protein tasor2 isoform X3 [Cottoperca gobio]|uniref:Uncharacterized protein tasor2 isoform X3 n=1 Tax=Cottoperca gobio TaxID=56716 RepID=A0A6J2PVV2_COTGO|nr:uncharacterized protein LOC115010017 isoform X3 [Cottoperca gobio]
MESGNGGASSKGVLIPVSESSLVFLNNILAPVKSAYLYEESKQSFRYTSAALVKNPVLEEKYNAFRANRRDVGYSEEDLEESYGFLLFDDVNKANALGETGVLIGNSTCTTLGDPSNGVYISMYSDCLDLNRWYHGKSGYIAIIRLTKGRVKKVLENYTQNLTAPTVGFDCHVSEQLPSVSSKTSSFLAFERTQYYMYELLNDDSNVTTQSPSAACPFAIVSFSYTDTKATLVAPQEKSEEKKLVCYYFPWRGQLQIDTLFYDVGLRSTAGALIPVELPSVVKISRAISMLDLRQLLPKAVFETCFSGEVFLDGLYYTLCELVSTGTVETQSLSLLLREIKEKDLALTIQLHSGGFLILLHSSHFLTYDDTGSNATEVLQGMFVFPASHVIQRDTKCGHQKTAMSSELLRVLPVLSYAEGEVEKTPIDPGTPFQVSPLSGSTRLLHHHQTKYGDGIKTLHPSVSQKVRSEQNHMTPENLKKHIMRRRKFRHSRTFVNNDESIQVTKQWKENYDFDLDSKFTNDSKDRTIVRALHGSWDFSMQDTSEEVRLIVHMWIGLFYSRSTARFFNVDSYPCSEESDSLEMSSGILSTTAQSELKANSFALLPSVTATANPSISKALDLTKKDDSVLDQGSVILDLSLKNSNAKIVTAEPQVNRKKTFVCGNLKETSDTLNTLKSSVGLQEAITIQCYKKMVQSTEIINELNDLKRTYENERTCTPSQKAGSLEHTAVQACKDDGTFLLIQEEMKKVSLQPEIYQISSGIGHILHGCNHEKIDMKDGIENLEATEMSLLQKHGRDSSKSVTDIEVDSNKDTGDMVHTVKHDEIELKEKPCQEGNVEPSPKVIHTDDDSKEELGIVCNGSLLEDEKQSSGVEPITVSLGKAENVKDVDCCTVHNGKVIEDPCGKENGLDEKDRCVSPVDLVNKDCITECNHKPPLDEQPPEANNEEVACHDLHFRKPFANGSPLIGGKCHFRKISSSAIRNGAFV